MVHAQIPKVKYMQFIYALLDYVEIDILEELCEIPEHYGTVEAEVIFHKYLEIDDEILPPVLRLMKEMGLIEAGGLRYKGPKNPKVPAKLIVEALGHDGTSN